MENLEDTSTLTLPKTLYYSLLLGAAQRKISDPAEYLEALVNRETARAALEC
jgi:hypothetical protein